MVSISLAERTRETPASRHRQSSTPVADCRGSKGRPCPSPSFPARAHGCRRSPSSPAASTFARCNIAAIYPHRVEIEHHVQLVPLAVDDLRLFFERDADRFAHRHHVVLRQHLAIHLLQVFVAMRSVGPQARWILQLFRREIGQARLLRNQRNHVHAKPIHALVEPEPHQRKNVFAHLGIVPVQIRLLHRKQVQIKLLRRRIKLPRRSRKVARIIVRRQRMRRIGRVRPAIAPDVVVAIRIVFRRPRLPQTNGARLTCGSRPGR